MNELKKAWRGEEKLWKVFWVYNFLLGIAFNYLLDLVPAENLLLFAPFLIIYLVWAVWVFVSIWRCAFNVTWKGWGYIARGLMVIVVVVVLLAIVAALAPPASAGV